MNSNEKKSQKTYKHTHTLDTNDEDLFLPLFFCFRNKTTTKIRDQIK